MDDVPIQLFSGYQAHFSFFSSSFRCFFLSFIHSLASDHADRFPAPDSKHLELALHRRHLHPTLEGLSGDNTNEYAVYKAVLLTIGHEMDVLMTLAEVPPDEVPVPEAAGECTALRFRAGSLPLGALLSTMQKNDTEEKRYMYCFYCPTHHKSVSHHPTPATTIEDQKLVILGGIGHARGFAERLPRFSLPELVRGTGKSQTTL